MVKLGINLRSKFLKAEWVEEVSKKTGNPYSAYILYFEVEGEPLKHFVFNPKKDADKRYVNEFLRNFTESIGVDYDSVPAPERDSKEPFKDFVMGLSKDVNKKVGKELYLKTMKQKNWVALGITLPVFSSEADLGYSSSEQDSVQFKEGTEVKTSPF